MSKATAVAAYKELGQGLPPELIHSDIDLAFASECTAPPSAAHPIVEVARHEIRIPIVDADVLKTFGKDYNVWGTPDGQPPAGVAAATNTLGTPGLLPGPHIIFGWRIRILTEPETRRIPGNFFVPADGSSFLPGSPDVWSQNDLLNAMGVPTGQTYLPAEFLFGLPTWRFAYAFQQAYQANWFVNHQEQIWKEPLTQCSVIEPFSEAEAAGLAFTTNQDTILDLNRRLIDLLGAGAGQFLPEKFVRTGSVTSGADNVGLFSPSRSTDAAATIFGGTGVPGDALMKKPYLFASPIFWPRGQPMNFIFEVNSNTIYHAEMQRWLSITGGTNGQTGQDQNLPFSDVLSGLMPTTTAANRMIEQTDDAAPANVSQQVQTNINLQKGGKVIVEVGLIAKRVPPQWYDAVARALVMKAIEAPEGPGDLSAKVDSWRQALIQEGRVRA